MVYEEDFTFQNLQCTAICLAKLKEVTFEKVQSALLDGIEYSEKPSLNHNVRARLIATGIYLLHSDGRHIDELIPFLLKILSSLPYAKWIDDGQFARFEKVPMQEQFAFCYNTVLSELAAHYVIYRDQIISAQLDVLACTTDAIIDACEQSALQIQTKTSLMRNISLILGFLRSFGRYNRDKERPLITAVFPSPLFAKTDGFSAGMANEKFRPELLRLTTDSEYWRWYDGSLANDKADQVGRYQRVYSKHGCSFCLPTDDQSYIFSFKPSELDILVDLIERLLRKPTVDSLDEHATDVYAAGSIKRFPYKTVSECLSFVCIAALYNALVPFNLLKPQISISEKFAVEIKSLVTELFERGDGKLDSVKVNADERRQCTGRELIVNKSKMTVLCNTICLKLIVWATSDETEAELLSSNIPERLWGGSHGYRHLLTNIPIYISAVEALGSLAEKFPTVATTLIVPALSRFLLEPSPLFIRLASDVGVIGIFIAMY